MLILDSIVCCMAINQRIVEAFDAEAIQFAPPTTATFVAQSEERPLQLEMRETPENDHILGRQES